MRVGLVRVGSVLFFVHSPARAFRAVSAPALCSIAALIAAGSHPALAREVTLRPVADETRAPSPLLLLVSIRKQRIRVFDDNGEIASSRISSGQPGFDTPTGVFSILEKNVVHESNIYDGAPMPFMQRLTWSGIALHQGIVPGYRASHGCIRLPGGFAKTLFSMTKTGGRVVVAQDELQPVRFEHPNLFKPLPGTLQGAALGSSRKFGGGRLIETQVAANDPTIGTGEALAAMPGVSPELGAALDVLGKNGPPPRTRFEADQMAQDKVQYLQKEIQAAQSRSRRAAERAKTVLNDTGAAMTTLTSERKNIDLVRSVVKTVEQKQIDARKAFEAFFKAQSASSIADPKTEDREFELEDALLDATIEADNVRSDAARKEMGFAEVQTSLGKFEADRNAAAAEATGAETALKQLNIDLADAKKDLELRGKPMSVFISLKSQKIIVRQGFEPVVEAPIQIDTIGGPIGTHVFTAMRYGKEEGTFEWKLISAQMPNGRTEPVTKKNKKRDDDSAGNPPARAALDLATIALDAIDIPDEIRQYITERARPGSSVIVSDRDLPKSENGKGTEFVLLTR